MSKVEELKAEAFRHHGENSKPYYAFYEDDLYELLQEHTNQTLDTLKEKVIKQLEDLGIPNMVSKKELYDVMDVSTPQKIGEIKAKLEFLDLIDEVRE